MSMRRAFALLAAITAFAALTACVPTISGLQGGAPAATRSAATAGDGGVAAPSAFGTAQTWLRTQNDTLGGGPTT